MTAARFAGKGIIVTGGARGLGAAAARRFLAEGGRVLLADRDRAALDSALEAMGALGEVHGCAVDVSREEDVGLLVAEARARLGRLDVLINNAGIAYEEPFLDITRAHWDAIMAVNLTGCFLVGQAVARAMVAQGGPGAIVNTSSTNGLVGEDRYAHYNASKGGVTLLTKSMAIELAPHGIRVNAVCPGYIETDMSAAIDNAAFVDDYVRRFIPLGRTGRPEDVAGVFAFLASDDAAFMTGASVVVDGGQLAF